MAYEITSTPQWLTMSDPDFLALLDASAKYKQRSGATHHDVHLPELNARLRLNLTLPTPPPPPADVAEPFTYRADLSNTRKIKVLYLGNSMIERFKTTGAITHLGRLGKEGVAWNAGCGGDKNENVLYRLHEGLYQYLKTAQEEGRCDVKVIILASDMYLIGTKCVALARRDETLSTHSALRHLWLSFTDSASLPLGTNDVRLKKGLREEDVEAYRLLLMVRDSPVQDASKS